MQSWNVKLAIQIKINLFFLFFAYKTQNPSENLSTEYQWWFRTRETSVKFLLVKNRTVKWLINK